MLVKKNGEYLAGCTDLPLPNATHVASTWRVKNPICTLLAQLTSYKVIVHFIDCLSQLVSGAYKIRSVVATNLSDWSTTSNKASQCLNERVRFKRIGSFNMDCSAWQTCEKASIAFKFLSAFLNHKWTKTRWSEMGVFPPTWLIRDT